MKKYHKYLNRLFLIALLVLLSACRGEGNTDGDDLDMLESVKAPINENFSYAGTWQIKKIEEPQGESVVVPEFKEGDKLYLNTSHCKIGSISAINPSLSLKLVDKDSYLEDDYKNLVEEETGESAQIKILEITDKKNLSLEFICLDDDNMLYLSNARVFHLEKTSPTIPGEVVEEIERNTYHERTSSNTEKSADTALLLGLSVPQKTSSNREDRIYETILIRRRPNLPIQVYKIDNLLLPRSKGFYMVGKNRVGGNNPRDEIYIYPLSSMGSEDLGETKISEDAYKDITGLTPSYISIESTYKLSNEKLDAIYDLNNFSLENNLSIRDIGGESGLEAFKDTVNQEYASIGGKDLTEAEAKIDEKNIGLSRSSGKWYFKSTISRAKEDGTDTKNFTVDIMPLVDLPTEVDLAIPWQRVKTHSPNSIDAISSENAHIIIIQDNDEIAVYDFYENNISSTASISVPIEENSKIVMAEWAYGDYASSWEETFRSLETKNITYFR